MAPWPPGLPTLLNGKVVRFKVKVMTSISQVGERPQSYGFLAVRIFGGAVGYHSIYYDFGDIFECEPSRISLGELVGQLERNK